MENPSITGAPDITVIDDATLKVGLKIPGSAGRYTVTVNYGSESKAGAFSVKDYGSWTPGKIVLADNTLADKDSYTGIDANNPPVAIVCGTNTYGIALGIALHTSGDSYLKWAENGSTGCNTKFEDIICMPSAKGSGAAGTATFTGDIDGSDNWEYIQSQDPTGTANAATNYPAFNWVGQYNTKYADKLGSANIAWYMPSLAELCEVYKNRDAINGSLARIHEKNSDYADDSLGTNGYWSSSQDSYDDNLAWYVGFGDGYVADYHKSDYSRVCCIAGF